MVSRGAVQVDESNRPALERMASTLLELARRRSSVRGAGGQPVADLDLLTWTIFHRRQLKPGVRFDLQRHRYLVDLYRETAQEMVVYKASQMGASELAISYALHGCDVRQATVLYIFPTDVHVSDFSTARIGPAIEASPYLDRIIVEGGAAAGEDGRKKRGADRVTLKRVRDRFLYLRGGQVKPTGHAPQLKSIDADIVVFDEVDEMDPRAPAIGVKRLGHSMLAEIRWVSTPTFPEAGIHAKWKESDGREWHVRCSRCGHPQPITIRDVVLEWDDLERPVAWHGQGEGRAFAACRRCGGELDRLGPGEWVAAHPGRPLVGYHLTKLFSATSSLLEIVEGLKAIDETKRREVFNQDLGEPYVPRGGKLTSEILDACRREYAHRPLPVLTQSYAVAGADVGDLIHVVIREAPRNRETGEVRQLWAGAVTTFADLAEVLNRYRVQMLVIDALPETRKARELQAASRPGSVWLAYYVVQKTGTRKEARVQIDEDEGVVNLDRTRTLDEVMAEFIAGSWTLPAYARDVEGYYAHLVAPTRVLEDGPHGQKVAVYRETAPDHFAHAENYCRVALDLPRAMALPPQDGVQKGESWD